MSGDTKVTIGKASLDTEKLGDRLLRVPVGETILYATLSDIVGRDVQREARHNLAAARRRVLREHQVAFDVIRGSGLMRLTDAGKVETGAAGVNRIRRTALRSDRILAAVERYDDLDPDMRIRHNSLRTIYNATRAMTLQSGYQKVEEAVRKDSGSLSLGRTMKLFEK